MTEKPETIFRRSQGITFIAVSLNQEFSSTCRRKNHSEYNCDTFTWSGEHTHTRTWMCCKKAGQMIIRTLWSAFTQFTIMNEKKLLLVICGPGGGVQEEAAHKHSSNRMAWSSVDRNLVCNVKSSSTKGKAATGHRETEAQQLMSLRDSVWKGLYQKNTKITLLRGVQLIESLQSCAQVHSYAPSP